MKQFYAFLFLLASVAASYQYKSAAQGSLAALDARNGFRDAKLGTARSQFKGLKADKFGSFERPSDSKKIGDIPLKYIRYNFYKGKLAAIQVMADSSYKNVIISTLKDAYGPGEESVGCYRAWKGNNVVMTLPMMVLPDNDIVGILIKIESIEISRQIDTDNAVIFERLRDKNNEEAKKISKKRQSDL